MHHIDVMLNEAELAMLDRALASMQIRGAEAQTFLSLVTAIQTGTKPVEPKKEGK